MTAHYCSQCYWSTNKPDAWPPYWYCVLHKCARITRDEDATECVDYLKIDVNVNQSIISEKQEQK